MHRMRTRRAVGLAVIAVLAAPVAAVPALAVLSPTDARIAAGGSSAFDRHSGLDRALRATASTRPAAVAQPAAPADATAQNVEGRSILAPTPVEPTEALPEEPADSAGSGVPATQFPASPVPETPTRTALDGKAEPLLERPTLVNPLVRELSPGTPGITLDPTRDYVVRVRAGSVFRSMITIKGGRNVVFENAVLQYDPALAGSIDLMPRAVMLAGQTGVMWIKNLQIRGPVKEGIQMEQKAPGVAVVLQDIAIDPLIGGTYAGWHSDLLQTWAGPSKLVVDGFTGSSDYQGFFLKPNQLFLEGPKPEFFWFRDVALDISKGYFALWTDGFGAYPVQTTNVVVKAYSTDRNKWLYPQPKTGDTTWAGVLAG